jgi:hypothetical protein
MRFLDCSLFANQTFSIAEHPLDFRQYTPRIDENLIGKTPESLIFKVLVTLVTSFGIFKNLVEI